MKKLIMALLGVGFGVALAAPVVVGRPLIQNGFTDTFRVFMATGKLDNAEQPDPPFVDCFNGFCDGDYFQRVVMGRSDAEIVALEELAKDFFLERFGIDVDDPANEDRIDFLNWMLDPRANYRNYVAGQRRVPPEGWFLFDGGWVIIVTDPNGYTLGGEWDGFHVGPDTLLFFGNYHILETNKLGQVVNRVNIFYRSAGPLDFDIRGEGSFRHELSLDGQDFPTGSQGVAQGLSAIYQVSPTAVKYNIRNVLTFGPSQPFNGLGPDGITGDIPFHR